MIHAPSLAPYPNDLTGPLEQIGDFGLREDEGGCSYDRNERDDRPLLC
jgi:hypothetical protein